MAEKRRPLTGRATEQPAPDVAPANGKALDALTLTQAAKGCGVHRNTIRRYLDAGRLPNAFRDGERNPWKIPRVDLINAGLSIVADPQAEEFQERERPREELTRQLEALRQRVQEMTRRADVAEALAAERQRHIEDLRRALGALSASGRRPDVGT